MLIIPIYHGWGDKSRQVSAVLLSGCFLFQVLCVTATLLCHCLKYYCTLDDHGGGFPAAANPCSDRTQSCLLIRKLI